MWAIVENGSVVQVVTSPRGVKAGDISYPPEIFTIWSDVDRAKIGVYPASYADERPTRFHVIEGETSSFDGSSVSIHRTWKDSGLDAAKATAKTLLSMTRRQKVEAGFDFNGMHIPTDPESQRSYTAAYVLANDYPNLVRKWKLPVGFVELDAAAIKSMGKAVSDYIQLCFDEHAVKLAALEAATRVEEIEALLG